MQAQGALGCLTCDLRAKPGTAFCPRRSGYRGFPRVKLTGIVNMEGLWADGGAWASFRVAILPTLARHGPSVHHVLACRGRRGGKPVISIQIELFSRV